VDLAVGITGIAGPGGGSEAKPVGTVCIAVDGGATVVRTFRFPGGREMVKALAATSAIDMVRRFLSLNGVRSPAPGPVPPPIDAQ
jgi:nicotinamide-nucleotide amidase